MVQDKTMGSKIMDVIIWILITLMTLSCLLPLINVVAISFSDKSAVAANLVGLIPIDFSLSAYKALMEDNQFWRSFGISSLRVVLGTSINLILTILLAYPLSKPKSEFHAKGIYMNIVIFAMLFSGGMVPIYITVKNLNLLNTIWSLILPGAVPIFNVILLMNFFKGVPKSLEEAATIDGASVPTVLFKIFLPVSLPALATITLFAMVGHWNDFFNGLLYINKQINYPLQTYIQQLRVDMSNITDPIQIKNMSMISNRTLDAAKIVIATVPLLLVYPFMQKYFVTGIVMGSVKE